ncbi:MAG: uncharacterized protein QG656_790 [Candidatus Hydrogenedentes bacterium]|nr:uncharacterized protein [Candidatus Hydrogenedentota bacterium]
MAEWRKEDKEGPRERTPAALWAYRLKQEAVLRRGKRRPRLVGAALWLVLHGLGLWNRGVRNASQVVLTRHTFAFPDLPEAFDGFRLLFMADLHFREEPDHLEALCAVLDRAEADLCVLAGDYRCGIAVTEKRIVSSIEKALAACKTRHGIAGVLGNNDTSDLLEPLRRTGARILINEAFELRLGPDSLWIAGVDDPRDFRCDNLGDATGAIPPGSFAVLLAHSPECIPDAARRGIAFYLCGHTHGGQICLSEGRPLFANCACPRRYARGPWRYDAMQGYTTTGVGTTAAPVRYHCPAEVALIELRRE